MGRLLDIVTPLHKMTKRDASAPPRMMSGRLRRRRVVLAAYRMQWT
jgi:hypothetical protein